MPAPVPEPKGGSARRLRRSGPSGPSFADWLEDTVAETLACYALPRAVYQAARRPTEHRLGEQ